MSVMTEVQQENNSENVRFMQQTETQRLNVDWVQSHTQTYVAVSRDRKKKSGP